MVAPPFRVRALYDYSSKEDDDLKFLNGQIVTVTDEEDADWYFGEYEDAHGKKQEGLFPKNFVKAYEPETPPRPSRLSRSKKEMEPPVEENGTQRVPSETSSPQATSVSTMSREIQEPELPLEEIQQAPVQATTQTIKVQSPPAAPSASTATESPPPASSKAVPPPASEKPVSGSFRDRINAFNKPAAPPVAPMKPSGLGQSGASGFVKKPFVAPPPSKNAYIPPPRETPAQKVYRREEDPEVVAQTSNDVYAEEVAPSPTAPSTDDSEDPPKPTSLKDRIALLQKQQMEQAARHAEAGQKKEKPKRPSKRQAESGEATMEQYENLEGEELDRIGSAETTRKRSMDASRDVTLSGARPAARSQKSREDNSIGSPVTVPPRDLFSDGNDADQSGAGDTEGEETSTGRDDSDEKPRRQASIAFPKPTQAPIREPSVGDTRGIAGEDDQDEEEEEPVDPEVKRRLEIRERMAKMSGGMGMAGMFGPSGSMPPKPVPKQISVSTERKASNNSAAGSVESPKSRAPPVPIMPMSGHQKVRSPEQIEPQAEVAKEDDYVSKSIVHGQDLEAMPDIEDIQEEPLPVTRRSTERPRLPPVAEDRPVPPSPSQSRAAPPPVPSGRPVPTPPSESRSLPRPPPSQLFSPSEVSESGDELSARPMSREGPPPMPTIVPQPSLPSRPKANQPRISDFGAASPRAAAAETLATSPFIPAEPKRSNRVPSVPGLSPSIPSAPQNRAPPPPPPPTAAAPSRTSTIDRMPPTIPKTRRPGENDEEITEYDGDYDTDMASGATHKDALKSHARVPSLEDDSTAEEASLHHSGLPSLGPTSSAAPRAVPPPPPNQPPRNNRQSSDMPRAAPPPPPPKEQTYEDKDEEYDPYKYTGPAIVSGSGHHDTNVGAFAMDPSSPRFAEPENLALPGGSPPQPARIPPRGQYDTPRDTTTPSRLAPRQSLDVQRTSTSVRRSVEIPHSSSEHGFMAGDVDLSEGSKWWAQPDAAPPVFQNRRDILFETEETSTTRRGGKQAVTRTVYLLFMDYSQTVVIVHFEAKDPTSATLEQHHEPPPTALRQDQLENAHTRFGARIAENAGSKKETTVGDGSPHTLVLDLLSSLPEALLPVGVRAYGALVYTNLANASVRQFDEIRPGDIVTFRNAKFQGHRGPMHSKYSVDVGKPDHVGVVVEWDGTKKKVRAWEQGRESKKVKSESFKFGDLRSGEVKVWRVMARTWVGWQGQN